MFDLQCIRCGSRFDHHNLWYTCTNCGDLLDVRYDYGRIAEALSTSNLDARPLSVWKYQELLPILNPECIVTLHEGGTNLYDCKRLAERLGVKKVYVKNEGENPTGSFKDRGMTIGITKAMEAGVKLVLCASTGNTSASLSAYAAKAGIECMVLVPSGKIALGKLAQALIYGAKVIQLKGNFDQALKIVIELANRHREVYLLNSINPYRPEGQKTLAFEVLDQLDRKPPSTIIVPVGNGGNITAIWKGFKEYQTLALSEHVPRMIGIQAEGAAPVARAVKEGMEEIQPVLEPETVATAIRIGAPRIWKRALTAIRESEGTAETVGDGEILEAQRLMAKLEGLFVEPASAATVAGLKKLVEFGVVERDEVVVCVATGHGLKDPGIIQEHGLKPIEADVDMESIEKLMGF